MVNLLVVEDDQKIAELIRSYLNQMGYCCTCAYEGQTAAQLLELHDYDLILLDVILPDMFGYELMDYIRPQGVPVIMLTALSDVGDKIKGLRLGAEDYMTKPFDCGELAARVETVLRRCGKGASVIEIGDVTVDTNSRVVTRSGKPVKLTKKEYDLLLLFVHNQNIALYRERIYEKVWGDYYFGNSRTVDLHVQRMRRKLGWERRLVSVYKIGYRLEVG